MSTHGNRVAPLLPAGVRLAGGDAPGKLRSHHPECTIECTGALQGLDHVLHDLDEVPSLHPTSRRSIRHRTSCNHVLIDGRCTAFHPSPIEIVPAERVNRSNVWGKGGGRREGVWPLRLLISARRPAGATRTEIEDDLKIASNTPTRVQHVGLAKPHVLTCSTHVLSHVFNSYGPNAMCMGEFCGPA